MPLKTINTDAFPECLSIGYKDIPSDPTTLLSYLTEKEKRLIANVKSTSRQTEIITVHRLLAEMFGSDVTLCHNSDGSPYIENSNINISISHCKGMVAIATHPDLKIGLDIERWRDTLQRVKSKFLSDEEAKLYNTPQLLLTAWTIKEAVYKAAGHKGLDLSRGITLPHPSTPHPQTAMAHLPSGNEPFTIYGSCSEGITTSIAIPITT